MNKKASPKKLVNPGRGPIARKVIDYARNHLRQKVTSLSDWREGKLMAEEYQKTVISDNRLSELDPLHGIYVYAQNQLSVLIEQLIDLPMLSKLADAYSAAEEEYMPSGPPMSPLTHSYFGSWAAFDLCTLGAKKETLCTIATDFCKFANIDEGLIHVYETLQASRMGIYCHEGTTGRFVLLRELITGNKIKAVSGSGYMGNRGEIWYARVLPPPFVSANIDYSVVFTTPYVLGKAEDNKDFNPFVEQDWLAFFIRNFPKTGQETKVAAYEYLMKYGLSRNYWNEYVFAAYRNHRHDVILLDGWPDIPESLPHTPEGRVKLGM